MEIRLQTFFTSVLILSLVFQSVPSTASLSPSSSDVNPPFLKAISDLRESIVKGLGFQAEGFKVSGFDIRDALVGQSLAYEFDLEIDNKVLPFKLVEDVKRWEYVDLPIFRVEDAANSLVDKRKSDDVLPVLAPFQLAGPMEIWIQDAKDIRLALPHDVDAGVLRKVILAEGAVVTVKGARSVSLRQPLEFPLPLNISNSGFASGILTLAEHLRHTSSVQGTPLLSLRLVGPTSLASPPSPTSSSSSSSNNNRLKLKRLAPGLVELSLASKRPATAETVDLRREAPTLLSPSRFTTLWPLSSINATNLNLVGFEKLLGSVLGPTANKKGFFKLLKADVSAQTLLKIGFGVEKKVGKEDEVEFPEWRTKPERVRMHFEVLAKVDGDRVVPERVVQVEPAEIEDNTIASNVLTGNATMSTMPIVNVPFNNFAL